MIEPNFNLLLWIIFICYGLSGIASVIAGVIGEEKSTHYDGHDVFTGFVALLICFVVCIF